jgi:hypothetical protein
MWDLKLFWLDYHCSVGTICGLNNACWLSGSNLNRFYEYVNQTLRQELEDVFLHIVTLGVSTGYSIHSGVLTRRPGKGELCLLTKLKHNINYLVNLQREVNYGRCLSCTDQSRGTQ